MAPLNRRNFLLAGTAAAGSIAGGGLLSGCEDSQQPAEGEQNSGKLTVWDQYQPQKKILEEQFAAFEKGEHGLPVEHTVYNPAKMGQALQLARQSKQLPDLTTLAGVGVPSKQLVDDGWFRPLDWDEQTHKLVPAESQVEGWTVFDGKIHSFPLFSFRQHTALNWFNLDLFAKADLDPENPPQSYDDIRAAAAEIKKAGGGRAHGWIAPLTFTGRLADQLHSMAEAAGSPTREGQAIASGETVVDNEHYLNALEFWLAMKIDGLMFPGSTNLDARTARARWATGVAGMFFDGCFNIGVLSTNFKPFVDKVGVGPIPVPETGRPISVNRWLEEGSFWLASTSRHPKEASALLARLAAPEYMVKVAEAMPAPPADLSAVDRAKVHPTYQKSIDWFREQVYLAPSPIGRNPNAALVTAEMKKIHPNLGEIAQAVMSGDIKDPKKALTKLADRSNAVREEAIKKFAANTEVSTDDFRFPDWKPGADYGPDQYR